MHQDLRPGRVVAAVCLYLASIALGLVSAAVAPVPGPSWFGAAIFMIMLLLAFALWRRQGWSRFAFLVLFVLGLPVMFAIREVLTQRGTAGVAILLLQTALQLISLVLLFTAESSAWYKRKSVAAEQSNDGT